MRVLVACEESQEVCKAFRARGHEAYSCDLQPCSGGHPEWHLQMDALDAINLKEWDLLIAFPPCQKLSKAGAAHWKKPDVKLAQQKALQFVRQLMSAPIKKIAIENPVGKINTAIRKPNQRINPFHFGHPYMKETCLWLKGLSPIAYNKMNIVKPVANWVKPGNVRDRKFNRIPEGANGDIKLRSKTFSGIAKAMAEQWSEDLTVKGI